MATGHWLATTDNKRIRRLDGYLELGRWVASTSDSLPPTYATREALFSAALDLARGQQPVYLEFGVYRGDSLRWWSSHLQQPDAWLVGFDSFEGLPEDWNEFMPSGAFAIETIPQFNDSRVSLEIGWFDQTLLGFRVPENDQLIVNIDCDLYSSTSLVLAYLSDHLVSGTLIYFDELHDRDHELRALRDFIVRTQIRLLPIGQAGEGSHWLFQVH